MEAALTERADAATATPTVAALFAKHGAFVWRSLRALGVSEADVDDVTQEVFLVVHRRLPEFTERGSTKSWLYSIAVRCAHGWRRRPARRELATETLPEEGGGGDGEAALDARRRAARLMTELERLDEDKRVAFVLYEIERMTLKEIADTVGAPIQTVYSRLMAARKALRRAFGEDER